MIIFTFIVLIFEKHRLVLGQKRELEIMKK